MSNLLFPDNEMDKIKMSEAQYSKMILEQLEPYFLIDTEIVGTGPFGRSQKIDAIITPIDPEPWAKKDVRFGIEFKIPKKDGVAPLKAALEQCSRYKYSIFGRKPLDLVLLCPGDVEQWGIENDCCKSTAYRLIDYASIGMIKGIGDDLVILSNEQHVQWSKREGVKEGKWNTYKRN